MGTGLARPGKPLQGGLRGRRRRRPAKEHRVPSAWPGFPPQTLSLLVRVNFRRFRQNAQSGAKTRVVN